MPTTDDRPTVWSCGGGTQSAAIAALIVQGRLPKPDYSVMVDTGREQSATWLYMAEVIAPNLAAVGVTVEIVKTADYATVGIWGGADGRTLLLPVFTTENTAQTGAVGKMTNFCSHEWKSRVFERYLKKVHGLKRWTTIMGISTDEMRRMRVQGTSGNPNYYPLIETVPMRRSDCYALVTGVMGWPKPPRSSCKECPNKGHVEWVEMRRDFPADFAEAVAFDIEIRKTDPNVYLHPSGKPLGEVDFDAQSAFDLFGGKEGCDSGMCFV